MSNKEGTAWDKDDAEEAPAQKTGNAWGKPAATPAVQPVVSLAKVQEEEEKRLQAEREKKQQEDRQVSGTYKPKRHGDDSWGAPGGAPRPSYGDPSSGGFGSPSVSGFGSPSVSGGFGSPSVSGGYSNQREDRRDFQPRERERHPIPDRAPFTAYIGNLPYDKADEDQLLDYFGELGVSEVRVVRDTATGRPKGYAYIEFNDRQGLENAISADGEEFGGRKLLVDVASTKDSRGDREEDRSRWGPRDGGSSASGFGRDRESSGFGRREGGFGREGGSGYGRDGGSGFGRDREGGSGFGRDREGGSGFGRDRESSGFGRDNREREGDNRYDATGPSSWRAQGRAPTSTADFAPASSGPPRIALQPRSQPVEEIGGPTKRAGEDPFGGAASNADKLKRQAEERLKREQETERKEQERLQRLQQQRERERETKEAAPAKDSWRGGPRENTRQEGGGRGGRGGRTGTAVRYDNSWGPGAAASSQEGKSQRAPEVRRGPSKQETDKAEAVSNPYALLNNEEDNQ